MGGTRYVGDLAAHIVAGLGPGIAAFTHASGLGLARLDGWCARVHKPLGLPHGSLVGCLCHFSLRQARRQKIIGKAGSNGIASAFLIKAGIERSGFKKIRAITFQPV